LGNEEIFGDCLYGNIVAGSLTVTVESQKRGTVVVHKLGRVGLAPFRGVSVPPQIYTLFKLIFEVEFYESAEQMKWSKALLNMMGNGVPALLGWLPERVYSDPIAFRIEMNALRETATIMRALGIAPINLLGYPVQLITWFVQWPLSILQLFRPLLRYIVASGRGGKLPSIAADLAKCSPRTEVPWLYGRVAACGHALGIRTPVCRLLTDVLSIDGTFKRGRFLDNPQAVLREIRHAI